jgi:AcrR family transcriptional regulator
LWSFVGIINIGGIYMNALSDIKSKIEKNKEEKRERLLASATALFAEKNFNNTSISDIVNKAKVAKGTFYLYFKDKYDIRNQIVQEISTDLFDDAVNELKKHPEITHFDDSMIFIINHVIDALVANPTYLTLMNKDLSLGVYSQELTKILEETDHLSLYELFKEGVERENLNIKNIDITFFTIVELVGSTCFSCIVNKVPCPIEDYKPYLFDLIRTLLHAAQ